MKIRPQTSQKQWNACFDGYSEASKRHNEFKIAFPKEPLKHANKKSFIKKKSQKMKNTKTKKSKIKKQKPSAK